MIINPIKTQKIVSDSNNIFKILDMALGNVAEGSVVVVTSKIISICEGSVIPFADVDKEELVIRESNLYLPAELSKYHHHFTIINNTLISMAGIDESNSEGHYVLWPRDSQRTANEIRQYLADKYSLSKVGVIITDSTSQPLRRGTTGICLAHSGFAAVNDYVGKQDLFGKSFGVTVANIAGGLAAAAVLVIGEGAEQTPICIISDIPFVTFQSRNPTQKEIDIVTITPDDDLFAPFLGAVNWQQGERKL